MQHLLSSFVLSSSINIDNFAVGIAYGIKKLRINILGNLLIAFVSGVGTFVSMSAGKVISDYLPHALSNALGSGALVAFGIWSIWATLRVAKKRKKESALMGHKKERVSVLNRERQASTASSLGDFSYESYIEHPEKADIDKSGYIEPKESIALACSLTINNLGCGVGAGISELSIVLTPVLTFIFSFLGITVGYILGSSFTAKMSGIWAGIVSGCLILGLGGYEYFVNSGIPQEQKALIGIMRDESWSVKNRLQAAVALGAVKNPTIATIDALWEVVKIRKDSLSCRISDTAILALGRISGAARPVNHDLSKKINGQLSEYLNQKSNNEELTIIILKAISNTSDPSLVRVIAPFISSESKDVKKSAVQAYRNIKDAHSLSILAKALAREKNAYSKKGYYRDHDEQTTQYHINWNGSKTSSQDKR